MPRLVDTTMFWSATGGGVRRYVLRKQEWLRRYSEWRHTIVAPGVEGPGMVDCGGLPLPAGYRLPLRRDHAAALLAQAQPDLIEVGDPYRLAWAALDAAEALRIPTLAFCHSNLGAMAERFAGGAGGTARLARRSAEAYLRRVYQRFDRVLAPSLGMVEELRQLGIAHVEHQALGVDSRLYHPRRRDPAWRASLGLPAGARLLLYVGRFAPEKNLDVLVAAIERLGPPYYLLAAGQGPVPPGGDRVRLLPYESGEAKLATIYASVDGFLHAGDQETFGLSVLEAMASGTPLVVRAAAGLKELVKDNAGIRVDSAAPGEWAEAIAEVFSGSNQARVRHARRQAEALDWDRVMPDILARYQRLLAGRHSRDAWGGADVARVATSGSR